MKATSVRMRGLVVSVLVVLSGTNALVQAAAKPTQILEFAKVTHKSTWNGQVSQVPVYAGRNKAKILYAIMLKAPWNCTLCVETTTNWIGRFAPTDYQLKGDLMLVNATAVPTQADDLTLNVVALPKKGYRLTIAQDKNTLICEVPMPEDELDRFLKNPVPNLKPTALMTTGQRSIANLERKADTDAERVDRAAGKTYAAPPGGAVAQMPARSEQENEQFRTHAVQIIRRMQDNAGPSAGQTEPPADEGAGRKTLLPPYQDGGTRCEKDTSWTANGVTNRYTGEILSVTNGIGMGTAKTRGECYAWMQEKWTCNKTGKLSATGTFVNIAAEGTTSAPVQALGTNTGYLYVGVRNERSGKDIWKEFNLGRAPTQPVFANVLPLWQVTGTGLDVQNGDQITFMVGVCDYSSGKYGNAAQGTVTALVQMIKVEVN